MLLGRSIHNNCIKMSTVLVDSLNGFRFFDRTPFRP